MNRTSKILILCCAALSWFSMNPGRALAQEEAAEAAEAAPKPAARVIPTLLDSNEGAVNPNQDAADAIKPDNRPLTGIQSLTLGSQEFRHSYFVPGFQYTSISQSRSLSNTPGWSTSNYLGGNLSLLSASSRSQLALSYSGGGFVSSDKNVGNGFYHQLGALESFKWGRWRFDLLDEFLYLPESRLGFGGATQLGVPGVQGTLAAPLPGLSSDVTLAPGIFTSNGAYYTNSFAAEGTYALTPRASITMAGSYGFLRFVDPGNTDYDAATANLGYNYELSRIDSVGALYRFNSYHFLGNPQALGVHGFYGAYGRKITGRLALQLTGGPEVTVFRLPINGRTQRLVGAGSASLSYALQRAEVSLAYSHRVSGGSGVLTGAITDELSLGGNRQISRSWTLLGSFGYGRNRDLTNSGLRFNSWFATAGFAHPLAPTANLRFGYTARLQNSSQGACVGSCLSSFTQHEISLGVEWNTRPFVIR